MATIAPITHVWPFSGTRKVASKVSAGSPDPDLAYLSAGGGIYAIDLSTAPESPSSLDLWDAEGDPKLRTDGYIWDIKIFGQQILAAAGTDGVARWDASSSPKWNKDVSFKGRINDARAVAIIPSLPFFVVVADRKDNGDGHLHLVRVDDGPSYPKIMDTYVSNKLITAIDVSTDVLSDTAVILATTECGGVLRFDVDISNGPPPVNPAPDLQFPSGSPTDTWNPSDGTTPFFRDVVIDSDSSPKMASVSAYHRGVWVLDLEGSPPGLAELDHVEIDAGGEVTYSSYIALVRNDGSPALSHLVVALGNVYKGEFQHSDTPSGSESPCDCSAVSPPNCFESPGWEGVRVFETETGDEKAILQIPAADPSIAGIDVRPVSESEYYIDAATANGLLVIHAERNPVTDQWSLELIAAIERLDLSDVTTRGGVNDVAIVNDVLYASVEIGVIAFDIASHSPEELLEDYTGFELGFANQFGGAFTDYPARMYYAIPEGDKCLSIWDIETDPQSPTAGQAVNCNGASFSVRAIEGLEDPNPQSPTVPNRWVYAALYRDFDIILSASPGPGFTPGIGSGLGASIKVLYVGSALNGNDSQIEELGVFGIGDYLESPATAYSQILGMEVREIADPECSPPGKCHAIYVSYGPSKNPDEDPAPDAKEMGLLVLRARWTGDSPSKVEIEKMAQIPAVTNLAGEELEERPGLVTYDDRGATQYLYVALGGLGLAVYDVTEDESQSPAIRKGLSPTLVGHQAFEGSPFLWQALPAKGTRLYLSFINVDVGIGVLDDFMSVDLSPGSDVTYYRTRYQTFNMVHHNPESAEKSTIFVGDGAAGLSRIEFTFGSP